MAKTCTLGDDVDSSIATKEQIFNCCVGQYWTNFKKCLSSLVTPNYGEIGSRLKKKQSFSLRFRMGLGHRSSIVELLYPLSLFPAPTFTPKSSCVPLPISYPSVSRKGCWWKRCGCEQNSHWPTRDQSLSQSLRYLFFLAAP